MPFRPRWMAEHQPLVDDRLWRREPSVLFRATPRSLIVFARDGMEPVRVEGSAVVVWRMLESPRRTSDVVALVAREASASHDLVSSVVDDALDILQRAGAVTCER